MNLETVSILSGIENKSAVVYRKQIDGDPYYVKWCCDFTLLERKCIEFIENKHNQSQIIEKSEDLEIEMALFNDLVDKVC